MPRRQQYNSHNAMTDEQITVATWAPSPQQRAVLDRYAIGYNWHRACVLSDVDYKTVWKWRQAPEFAAMAEQMRRDVLESVQPQFAGIIDKAQRILLRVGDDPGDLDPDSSLAAWAERILSRTLWPVLVARGMAAEGITINAQQALRLAAGIDAAKRGVSNTELP